MKCFLSSCVFSIVWTITMSPTYAAISFTGGVLFENFDSLPTSGISDYYENDSDVVEWGFQRELPGTTGWEGTQIAGSQGNGSTNGMHLNAITSAGSSTAGTVGSAGDATDRGIYSLASGSFTPSMGVEIVNNSASPLTSISIAFTQELWRTSGDNSGGTEAGIQNVLPAEWATTDSGVSSADFLTTGSGFTAVSDLNLTSNTPVLGDDALFIDGNDPANQQARSTTIDLSSTPIAIGESFFLRFEDNNDPGRDASIAIDNFAFSTMPIPDLSVEADRITGAITLVNSGSAAGPALIQGYSITSAAGSLNASVSNFKSITNHYDAGNPGPDQIDADDDWTILSEQVDGSSDLSEYQFGGTPGDGASIAVGQSVVLSQGDGVWIPTPDSEDLQFEFQFTGSDTVVSIPVTYTGNGGESIERSDLNHDGVINGLDWIPFAENHLVDLSSFTEAQQYIRGDLDGDGDNDVEDFLIFQADYDLANEPGAFAAMLQSVPEPSSLILFVLALLGYVPERSRLRRATR